MSSPWTPYRPSRSVPWSLPRAWTLRRRAGFGATWGELQRDLADGPASAVDRVLKGTCRTDGVPSGFSETAGLLGDAAAGSGDAERLKAWWLYQMLFTPDPLTERLALMWHNHFATSQLKVEDLPAMRRQNETFRKHARGRFGDLLRETLRDPALLVWLDAPANRAGKPNENLARELMELFTLGIGHYTERDVKEAARALTGRSVVGGRFRFQADRHDDGRKTLLGQTDRFDGDGLADLLLDHPATARRLAWRLCRTFLGEDVADEAALTELAAELRRHQLDIGHGVETVLRSELFFSDKNLHRRVCGPVMFAAGAVRALECFDPPPSTLLLAEWTTRLGRDLFFPPNVGGWPGGRHWLSARTIIGRANFAAALTSGRLSPTAAPPDLQTLARRHRRSEDPAEALTFFDELLTGGRIGPAGRSAILKRALRETSEISVTSSAGDLLHHAVALLLASPEAQLH